MSDITLETLIDQFRNKINEIVNIFIINTHCDTNRTFQHVRLPLQYETHRTDYNYAFDKVEELIKLLNTKTGNTFNKLSADDIKKFLARSPSTLFGNIAGAFFCTSIEDICVVTNIVDQEQKDKIDGGPLVTPKLIVDRDQEKK
ncbi:unnamed protein product [Rotaria socialis]|uniref:Uncharacterized protein n=1 Tax=Rotaria socialis TaxID=392032 RepID=A0A818F5M6_9BILA|nr:unnamed protein product [Rotaria socialis]